MVIYIVAAAQGPTVVLHATCLTKVNSTVKLSYAKQTLRVYPGHHSFRAIIEIELNMFSFPVA
jgi:hypothetical protein